MFSRKKKLYSSRKPEIGALCYAHLAGVVVVVVQNIYNHTVIKYFYEGD